MLPGRINTRTALVEEIYGRLTSASCKQSLREGRVRVFGGFSSIPPSGLPGWICQIRSRHGRTWLLALLVDENSHSYKLARLGSIPWKNWVGKKDGKGVYDGDNPQEHWREHRKSVILGRFDPVLRRLAD